MISTIVIKNFLSHSVLAISLRISTPLTACFNVEETETDIEESLTPFSIDYSQDSYVVMIVSYKCKISWCSYLNISLK